MSVQELWRVLEARATAKEQIELEITAHDAKQRTVCVRAVMRTPTRVGSLVIGRCAVRVVCDGRAVCRLSDPRASLHRLGDAVLLQAQDSGLVFSLYVGREQKTLAIAESVGTPRTVLNGTVSSIVVIDPFWCWLLFSVGCSGAWNRTQIRESITNSIRFLFSS